MDTSKERKAGRSIGLFRHCHRNFTVSQTALSASIASDRGISRIHIQTDEFGYPLSKSLRIPLQRTNLGLGALKALDNLPDLTISHCLISWCVQNIRITRLWNCHTYNSHLQDVDPMFIDPENGDFRFKPGSPALEMGIVPIDLTKVGLRSTKL